MLTDAEVRVVRLPGDVPGLRAMDTSYETTDVYEVHPFDLGYKLVRGSLPAPLRRPGGEMTSELTGAPSWTHAWVVDSGHADVAGFAAASYEEWNQRLRLWHLYTDRKYRRQGVARMLTATVLSHGRAVGARHVFVETPNVNAGAIATYLRLGFRVVGLDTSLYEGTPRSGETAIYLAQSCERRDGD